MSSIRILPENISNKIAAGEVIERPASIVKELVENSIDAAAKNIYVNIENAGKKLISVTDDGVGMDPDDALLCLEAHATSKISKEDDINNIVTMGFRGEALPSIASVARLRLRTRRNEMMEGTEVVVHGGRFINEGPTGCAPGTEIRITDIFYNTPARKKFLKSPITEEKHIFEALSLLALANPKIAFELKMDGKTVISSPADENILPRLGFFLGNHAVPSLVPVDYENSGIRVTGYVSKPSFVKNNRREQRVFINGRPIRATVAYMAIRDAYETMIMKGSYPVATLFIQLNPGDVDINVHPAKHEARFHNERLISSVIKQGISNSLKKALMPAPSVSTQKLSLNSIMQSAEVTYHDQKTLENETTTPSLIDNIPHQPQKTEIEPTPIENNKDIITEKTADTTKLQSEISNLKSEITLPGSGNIDILGTLDNTYILASASETGLIIIDQHAAHERILFEKLLNENNNENHSQKLLLPITINLSHIEANLIKKQQEAFSRLGFEFEPFGDNTVIVTAIPPDFPMDNISGLISDLLENILNHKEKKPDDSSIARTACKLAVKAHDALHPAEAKELIRKLAKCKLPFSCPHGRPTVINISFKELEKTLRKNGVRDVGCWLMGRHTWWTWWT